MAKLGEKIADYLDFKEKGRECYAAADAILEEIQIKKLKIGREFKLPGGRIAVLKDNFAEKNKIFRSHGSQRLDFEEVET